MYQHPNHKGIRRREEEQESENLFEKIMKEYSPPLIKKIDIQVQEAHKDTSSLSYARLKIRREC